MIQRRSFLSRLATIITAPAIVRAGSLMPVKKMPTEILVLEFPGMHPDLFSGDWWTSTWNPMETEVRHVREPIPEGD